MIDHPPLATPRLILRPLAPEHAPALHAVLSDPEAMHHWHTPPHGDLATTRQLIDALRGGTERAWAVQPRGGETVGLIYYLGNAGAPGLGYILAPHLWGQGLMAEALRAVLDYGFARLQLDRVELWIDADNMRSRHLAERSGFTRRGAFRQRQPHRPASHETLVYGLTQDEHAGAPPDPEEFRIYGLQAVLPVPDVAATAAFYRDKLGFSIAFLFGSPPSYGAVTLSDWSAGPQLRFTHGEAAPAGLSINIDVGPSVDALCEGYRAHGVEIAAEPETAPWGLRSFAVRDCNGYVLRFVTPV